MAFDLDDTLAPSKAPIDPRMAGLLTRLLGVVEVCIVSGGSFEQFRTQVLAHLPADPGALSRLHLMPTNGTRYYRFVDGGWRLQYAEDLSDEVKRRVVDVLAQGARDLGLWEPHPWGEIVEDRGSQITFSALGQSAPIEAKRGWDPTGAKRERLRAYASARLPDLEVRSGGSTSVDVTRKGVDKAYAMRKLMDALGLVPADVLFVGDRLDPGGNDHPVTTTGIACHAVTGWPDTAEYVERFLAGRVPLNR